MRKIIRLLKRAYPMRMFAKPFNAFELLIATIFRPSARRACKHRAQDLFRKYRKPEDYLKVSEKELHAGHSHDGIFSQQDEVDSGHCQSSVRTTRERCAAHMNDYWNCRSSTKTANVVLGNAFGISSE